MIVHASIRGAATVRVGVRRLLLLALLVPTMGVALVAAPQAELWPRWEAHDPASTRTVDHTDWARFLDAHLVTDHASGVNRVDYASVSSADGERLDAYVASLERVAVSALNRDEQLAFWINLYNAATVKLILDHYPVDSIRRIRPNLVSSGPWDMQLLTVEETALTLNDIEHRIIRPIWQDNRIHYVVNCASIGCPNLYPEPLNADNWDRVFEESAHAYITHPRGARFEGNRLVLSSIFDWYDADFGGDLEGVTDHIARYLDPQTAARVRSYRGRVRYEYDWTLNRL